METFGEFLTEGKDDKGGLTIFDIDDTLFKTTARVNVVKGGKKVKELKRKMQQQKVINSLNYHLVFHHWLKVL